MAFRVCEGLRTGASYAPLAGLGLVVLIIRVIVGLPVAAPAAVFRADPSPVKEELKKFD